MDLGLRIVSIFLVFISLSNTCVADKAEETNPQSQTVSEENGPKSETKDPEVKETLNSVHNENEDATVTADEGDNVNDSEQSNKEKKDEYGAGSLCVYCKYCKFCKLCEKDCPCETSKKRPNCHLCKYCSYCYLCTSACENFCQPGSFLDTISTAIYSALPKFDNKMKEEVNKDIESAKDWIKSYL